MQPYYQLLPPSADYVEIASIARDCVIKIQSKTPYQKIADEMSRKIAPITEAALRTFVSRANITRVHPGTNTTLQVIYDYLRNEFHSLEDDIQSVMLAKWNAFSAKDTRSEYSNDRTALNVLRAISGLFNNWSHVTEVDIDRLFTKVCHEYIMLRKSVRDKALLVKSTLKIWHDTEHRILRARHTHTDRHGVERDSDGFATSVVRNIYCVMQIENGEGLEIVALKEPVQQNFEKMMGFTISINTDRTLLSARVFIERNNDEWRKVPPRFRISELDRLPGLKNMVAKKLPLLDEETSLIIPDIVITDAQMYHSPQNNNDS